MDENWAHERGYIPKTVYFVSTRLLDLLPAAMKNNGMPVVNCSNVILLHGKSPSCSYYQYTMYPEDFPTPNFPTHIFRHQIFRQLHFPTVKFSDGHIFRKVYTYFLVIRSESGAQISSPILLEGGPFLFRDDDRP